MRKLDELRAEINRLHLIMGTHLKGDNVSNIVSLSDYRERRKNSGGPVIEGSSAAIEQYFEEVIEKNRLVRQRLYEERKQHNQRQKREYKLKTEKD